MKSYKTIKWTKEDYLIDKPNRSEDELADVYIFDDEYFNIMIIPVSTIHGIQVKKDDLVLIGYVYNMRLKGELLGYGSCVYKTVRQAKIAAHKRLIQKAQAEEMSKKFHHPSRDALKNYAKPLKQRSPGGKVNGKY